MITAPKFRRMAFIPTVRVGERVYTLDEFNEMERLDLLRVRRDVEGDLHEICAQIEAEELSPQHASDTDWLLRASRAKRAYTRALRHIDATLEIRKIEHQHSLLQTFINIAQEELPPDVFRELLMAAQEAVRTTPHPPTP